MYQIKAKKKETQVIPVNDSSFMIGACYIRVSTDDQMEYSPDAQLNLIRKYAKEHDIVIPDEYVFIDEGISGRKAEKRPEFMKMIATAKSKPTPFQIILVHKFDRFARSREDSVVYKSLLKKEAGIKVVSITESIEDDKFSVILEAMLEAMAEYYSLNLSDEVKKGMTEKATRGEYQTVAPFGYIMKDKKLKINPHEAEIVKFIFEKFSSRQMGMRKIAVYLNDIGVKTHRGNLFENRTIDYILNNPVYIGNVRWNPERRTRRNYSDPDLIIVKGNHEPIISIELWEKTQEEIRRNKEVYRYRTRTVVKRTWLSGLVRCGSCGRTLVINNKDYLHCNGYGHGQCKCSQSVKISFLETLIAENLKETYDKKLEIKATNKNNSAGDIVSEVGVLEEKLKKIKVQEERIALAFREGIDTLEEYKENKQRILSDKQILLEKLESIKQQDKTVETEETYEKIISVYELLNDSQISTDIKSETVRCLIEEVVFSKEDMTLEIIYK